MHHIMVIIYLSYRIDRYLPVQYGVIIYLDVYGYRYHPFRLQSFPQAPLRLVPSLTLESTPLAV